MFAETIIDIVLVIAGRALLRVLKVAKNVKLKILIIFSVISFDCLILWLNYRFIESPYNWLLSIIFIVSMFIEYFRYDNKNKNVFNDNYRGD